MRSWLAPVVLCAACGPELLDSTAVVDGDVEPATVGQELVTLGFDPSMSRACARSPSPAAGNGLSINDFNECSGTNGFWLLGNHAERNGAPGVSCTGSVASQSYPWVRGFGSNPQVGFVISGAAGQPKTWELKTDGVTNPPACGVSDSFHWNTIMLSADVPGVVLPDFNDPDASSRVSLWYNDYVPAGRARLMAGAEFCYSKPGSTVQACRQLEVNLTRTSWVDSVTSGPFAAQLDVSTAAHPGLAQYLQLDGSKFACNATRCFDCVMTPNSCTGLTRLSVVKGAPMREVFINWNFFLGWAISTGQFDGIDYTRPMRIKSINLATETNNRAIAHMVVKGFKVEQ